MRCDPSCRKLIGIVIVDVVCVALMAGCFGYQFGSTLSKNITSINVSTFVNKCSEPLIENDTTSAAKGEFQKDGTLTLASADEADLILDVTLSKYVLEPVQYVKTDPKTAYEYRLKITADIVVTQVKTKKILLKKSVEGQTTFYPGGDLNTAKRSALPKCATDLAHNIVESVIEAW